MIRRGALLALVAPGAIAIEMSAAPWAVSASTETFRPQMASAVPGCSSSRVERLVRLPAPAAPDHFSTKARSIT